LDFPFTFSLQPLEEVKHATTYSLPTFITPITPQATTAAMAGYNHATSTYILIALTVVFGLVSGYVVL